MKQRKMCSLVMVLLILAVFIPVFSQTEPVEPVNWRKLTPILIDLKGWESQGDPSGTTVNMGNYKMSQAERSYGKNGSELQINIIDGGYAPMAYAGFKAMAQFEVDSSDEYVKKTTIQGFTAIENYKYKRKDGTLTILVSDRFLVQLDGDDIEDMKELRAAAQQLDLKGLAALAK
jgi:hypothetical protein